MAKVKQQKSGDGRKPLPPAAVLNDGLPQAQHDWLEQKAIELQTSKQFLIRVSVKRFIEWMRTQQSAGREVSVDISASDVKTE